MFVRAIAFAWLFVTPATEGFFPAAQMLDTREAAGKVAEASDDPKPIDADDDGNAARYASMKRVLIRGAIDPAVIERAKTMVTLPMGTERVIVVNDKPYAFRLELHYHPPGFPNAPNGWHKGVTVYELVDQGDENANVTE